MVRFRRPIVHTKTMENAYRFHRKRSLSTLSKMPGLSKTYHVTSIDCGRFTLSHAQSQAQCLHSFWEDMLIWIGENDLKNAMKTVKAVQGQSQFVLFRHKKIYREPDLHVFRPGIK